MTRTTKISTVKVTGVDIINEKFIPFTVTVSDLGKNDSLNRKKISDAVKAVDGWKDSYMLGKWEIVSTKEELRYMPDDIWMKYSTVVAKDSDESDK